MKNKVQLWILPINYAAMMLFTVFWVAVLQAELINFAQDSANSRVAFMGAWFIFGIKSLIFNYYCIAFLAGADCADVLLKQNKAPVLGSLWLLLRYHLGSVCRVAIISVYVQIYGIGRRMYLLRLEKSVFRFLWWIPKIMFTLVAIAPCMIGYVFKNYLRLVSADSMILCSLNSDNYV